MVAPILYQICDAAHVSGVTLSAEIGADATLVGSVVVHADSIELLGSFSGTDIITDPSSLPLGTDLGGGYYESTDYTLLIDLTDDSIESSGSFVVQHGEANDGGLAGIYLATFGGGPILLRLSLGTAGSWEHIYCNYEPANGDRIQVVVNYAAATQTATFWVLDAAGAELFSDSLVLTNPLLWNTAVTSLTHGNVAGHGLVGDVYRRAFWHAALTPAEALAALSSIALPATSVSNAGGTRLDLYTDQLVDGQYLVFIGPNGDTTDTPAYPITRGAGRVIQVTDGYFSVVTPVLPIGGPYLMTFDAVSTGAGSRVSTEFLTVIPRNFASSTFSLRRNMFQQASAGALNLLDVPYPQE